MRVSFRRSEFLTFLALSLFLFPHLSRSESYIRSNIRFSKNTNTPVIQLADVSKADSLGVCPLETLPQDLNNAVSQLVTLVSNTVNKIKESQNKGCTALEERFRGSQSIIQTALQNQFIGNVASASQQQINASTQQALAVNQMMLTLSDMLQRQCITALDDRIVIQRLVGQVLTLSGLMMGGWQGITLAAGGQLLGNLPLFTNRIDQAIEIFQKYQEINQRGSFLCLFRQMQKTSCLLFSNPEDIIVHGLDMSFKTGITHTTLFSISQLKKEVPDLFQDIENLIHIHETSDPFMQMMEKPEVLEKGSLESFREIFQWCQNYTPVTLQNNGEHPQAVIAAIHFLNQECTMLGRFELSSVFDAELIKLLRHFYSSFYTVRAYYTSLKTKPSSKEGDIATTIESKKYFEKLRSTFDDYRNLIAGNPNRTNYFRLVDTLGDTLAKDSLKAFMSINHDTLVHSNFNFLTRKLNLPFFKPNLSIRVRQRSLITMIDLCKTFDPTLSCLFVETAANSSFYSTWKESCVGPKSTLCKNVLDRNEIDLLIEDPNYKAYFNSLCGTGDSLELRAFSK